MSLKKGVLSWFSPYFSSIGRILLFHAKGAKNTFTKGKFTFLFKVLGTEIPSCWRGYGRKISGYICNTRNFETFGLCERYDAVSDLMQN